MVLGYGSPSKLIQVGRKYQNFRTSIYITVLVQLIDPNSSPTWTHLPCNSVVPPTVGGGDSPYPVKLGLTKGILSDVVCQPAV